MSAQKCILIVPGVGDHNWLYKLALPNWQQKNTFTTTHSIPWKYYEPYEVKLKRLLKSIDGFYETYGPISLIGVSASSSIGLHAFIERKEKVEKFIAVSGWLSEGKNVFPPLSVLTFNYPEYKDAILIAQEIASSLLAEDKKRILTMHGRYDEIIPTTTSQINGVENVITPTYLHVVNAIYPFFFAQQQILSFLFKDSFLQHYSAKPYAFS